MCSENGCGIIVINMDSKYNSGKVVLTERTKTKEVVKAEQKMLINLLDDMYMKRGRVYRMAFFRGIFFGFGSILGGTLLIAVAIWLLSQLVNIPAGIGDFIQSIVDTIQNGS